MKRAGLWKISILSLALAACAAAASAAEMSADEKMAEEMKKYHFDTVTTKEGLKFNVPSDMPIQNKDGLVQPMEFDEYLYIKFKMIEDRVISLEKKLDEMDKKMDARFKELKELILASSRSSIPQHPGN